MLAYLAGILGVLWGIRTASKRGGNRLDMAQYAFGFGVACFVGAYLVLLILNSLI